MELVAFIFGLLIMAVPALFCVIPLNYFAKKLRVWLRALIAAIFPAALFAPLYWEIASGEPPMSDFERVGAAASLAGIQFVSGFIAAFLSARRHPVPEQDVNEEQAQ